MGNNYSHNIFDLGFDVNQSETNNTEQINNDNLIKHMNTTKDSLFVVTYKNKPVFYTLDYSQSINVKDSDVLKENIEEINNSGNLKVFKIKSIGY